MIPFASVVLPTDRPKPTFKPDQYPFTQLATASSVAWLENAVAQLTAVFVPAVSIGTVHAVAFCAGWLGTSFRAITWSVAAVPESFSQPATIRLVANKRMARVRCMFTPLRTQPITSVGVRNGGSDVQESFSPPYAAAMSTKHIDTAAELVRFGASVKVECGSCGASRTLGGPAMVKACGPGT